MWRALVFVGLLALAAFGAVWLADRPGEVMITWNGYRTETSVAVAVILFATTALLLAILWSIMRFFLRLPRNIGRGSRARRRGKGYAAISRGLIAAGSGDAAAARRAAAEAERLMGRDSLTLLLKAQAAQVSGDRAGAETAFQRMTDNADTRVLGLRGLFIEARRRGDTAAARDYAQEAARAAPAAAWANEAVLEAYCAEGDWRAAIANVDRRASLRLADKASARRQKAVLLAAEALAREETDPDAALASAEEAAKLAPDLVPAAAVAGRPLSRRAELRRGAKIIEAAWKANPHPDLAEAYVNLRPGDSGHDRLKRAESLARFSSWDPESRLAIARAALDAREFKQAHDVLQPLLTERPSRRVCLIMAALEQTENGPTGRVREWLTRAARAPRDAAWVAEGVVSDKWAPVSPVSGRLDAFRWEVPPDLITASSDDILGGALSDPEPAETDPKQALPAPAMPVTSEPALATPELGPVVPAQPAASPVTKAAPSSLDAVEPVSAAESALPPEPLAEPATRPEPRIAGPETSPPAASQAGAKVTGPASPGAAPPAVSGAPTAEHVISSTQLQQPGVMPNPVASRDPGKPAGGTIVLPLPQRAEDRPAERTKEAGEKPAISEAVVPVAQKSDGQEPAKRSRFRVFG